MIRTAHGGHLGFMFHQGENCGSKIAESGERASWMPSELSRFLSGVSEKREKLDQIGSALNEVNGVVNLR